MKKLLSILFMVLIAAHGVYAQGSDPKDAPAEPQTVVPIESLETEGVVEEYQFPVIKPGISVAPGYRFVDFSGSGRAEEYEFLHDSLTLSGDLRVFSFPHRFHLDIDIRNRKDYFGDVSYAYEDRVLFRSIDRSLFHNLDNIVLRGAADPSFGVSVLDPGAKYGVRIGISSAFLRLKTHDFPLHVYIDTSLVKRDGSQQLRNLQGSGFFNNIVRTSQSSDIDWVTRNLIIGANSHLGPVEVEFSHGEKRFDAGGNNVFFDSYSAASSGPPRAAGVYPHNRISELKGSSNTVKLHTSYTGGIVASATFSKIDRENRDIGATADYFLGAGEITWVASPKAAFFVKYRHRETAIENPDRVSVTDRSNPSNTFSYQVKPSISSINDIINVTARYRLVPGLTLKADYSYEDMQRKDSDAWRVPETTLKNTVSVSADLRLIQKLALKAKYTRRDINGPAYNTEPDHSDEGRVSLAWTPFSRVSTLLSYVTAVEKRDVIDFFDEDSGIMTKSPSGRRVNKDRLLGSITYVVLKDLSATASYSYVRNKIRQDISYDDAALNTLFDSGVPYEEVSNTYAFDINYIPKNRFSLSCGVSHTVSEGEFHPSAADLLQPVSIASFSQLRIKETVYTATGEYRFRNGFAAGVQYRHTNFDDALDNPFDDLTDSKAHIVLLTLTKKW